MIFLVVLSFVSQLTYRTHVVEEYERYASKYLGADRKTFSDCGVRSSQDFANRYAFHFPVGATNEFYVDDAGALQYFKVDRTGKISRRWSGTASPRKMKPNLGGLANNFILASSYGVGSITNQCGRPPRDRWAMDIFYFGHSYVRVDKNGQQVCRKELGSQFQILFKTVVSMKVGCHGDAVNLPSPAH